MRKIILGPSWNSLLQLLFATLQAAAVIGAGSQGLFSDYIYRLAAELGVQVKPGVLGRLQVDGAFHFNVPRFLLPGTKLGFDAGKLIGLVKQMKNKDEFDVRLSWPQEEPIHIKVRDRKKFGKWGPLGCSNKAFLVYSKNWGIDCS